VLATLPAIAANWAIKLIPTKLVQRSVVLSITVVFAPEPTAQPVFLVILYLTVVHVFLYVISTAQVASPLEYVFLASLIISSILKPLLVPLTVVSLSEGCARSALICCIVLLVRLDTFPYLMAQFVHKFIIVPIYIALNVQFPQSVQPVKLDINSLRTALAPQTYALLLIV
jgi:hypothetical protein